MSKNIVTRDNTALAGQGSLQFIIAIIQIVPQETSFIEKGLTSETKLFSNDIQNRCFPATIATIKNGKGGKFDFLNPFQVEP
nr:hypothetical protein [Akkermansia muciniphila]